PAEHDRRALRGRCVPPPRQGRPPRPNRRADARARGRRVRDALVNGRSRGPGVRARRGEAPSEARAEAEGGLEAMGRWAAFERRLSYLEQRPIRLTWAICLLLAPLVLLVAPEKIIWLVAFGITATLMIRIHAVRPLPGYAILLLPPVVWCVVEIAIMFICIKLGIVTR